MPTYLAALCRKNTYQCCSALECSTYWATSIACYSVKAKLKKLLVVFESQRRMKWRSLSMSEKRGSSSLRGSARPWIYWCRNSSRRRIILVLCHNFCLFVWYTCSFTQSSRLGLGPFFCKLLRSAVFWSRTLSRRSELKWKVFIAKEMPSSPQRLMYLRFFHKVWVSSHYCLSYRTE